MDSTSDLSSIYYFYDHLHLGVLACNAFAVSLSRDQNFLVHAKKELTFPCRFQISVHFIFRSSSLVEET